MATNLDITTASFYTDSMLPSPGDNIDSIWGQRIAENTGWAKDELDSMNIVGNCTSYAQFFGNTLYNHGNLDPHSVSAVRNYETITIKRRGYTHLFCSGLLHFHHTGNQLGSASADLTADGTLIATIKDSSTVGTYKVIATTITWNCTHKNPGDFIKIGVDVRGTAVESYEQGIVASSHWFFYLINA